MIAATLTLARFWGAIERTAVDPAIRSWARQKRATALLEALEMRRLLRWAKG